MANNKTQEELAKALAMIGAGLTMLSSVAKAITITGSTGGKPADDEGGDVEDETDVLEDAEEETAKPAKATKEQVLKAVRKVIDAGDDEAAGKRTALGILKKHGGGAKNVTELKDKFYAKVLAALNEELGE